MSVDEEIAKIIMRVEGEAEVKRLAIEIGKEEKAIRDASEALKTGAASHAYYDAAVRHSAQEIARLTAEQQKASSAVASSGGALGKYGNALTQLGYAADDAQYGFRGVANNIQPLLAAVPALAGIAPVIALAATAAFQLYEHWDQLAGIFGAGHVKTQAEEMEELRKKTSLTADEAERLARASRLDDKVKELRAARPAAERAEESAVTSAIVEAGSKEVAAGILRADITAVDGHGAAALAADEVKKAEKALDFALQGMGESEDLGAVDAATAALRAAKAKQTAAREATAEQLAASGALPDLFPGGREALADTFRRDPGLLGGNAVRGNKFVKALDEAAPGAAEEKAAQEHFDEQERANADKRAKWDEDHRTKEEAEEKAAQAHFDAQERQWADAKAKFDLTGPAAKKAQDAKDLKDAKDSAPGVEGLIREQLKQMGGGDDAARTLTNQLRARFGDDQATALVKEQLGGARQELMRDFVQGPDSEQRRNSQVIGAAGLADSIQSAVGGDDTAKKQLEQAIRQSMLLEQIASQRRPATRDPMVFDANGQLGAGD